jgi:hypothetical protein
MVLILMIIPLVANSATVSAGGKSDGKGNVVGSLCYLNGKVQILGEESTRTACRNEGGTIIEPGQAVPVPICVYGSRIQQLDAGSQGCTDVGGTQVNAGQQLPAILIPSTQAATGSQPADTPDCSLQTTNESASCKPDPDCVKDQTAANCGITRYLKLFVNVLTGLVGVAVVGSVIFGGIQYSMSAGDAQKVAAARRRISNALLALLVFALTYGFLQWIIPGGVL